MGFGSSGALGAMERGERDSLLAHDGVDAAPDESEEEEAEEQKMPPLLSLSRQPTQPTHESE